jgi:hypothetical protein
MDRPDPPLVTFDEITREVDIEFDSDFEFTPEAAERIKACMEARFPTHHIMTAHTRYDMESLAEYLQREAFERGEMQLKDPIGLAARRQEALDRLKEMPPSPHDDHSDRQGCGCRDAGNMPWSPEHRAWMRLKKISEEELEGGCFMTICVEAACESDEELNEEIMLRIEGFNKRRQDVKECLPLTDYEKLLLRQFLWSLIDDSKV